MNTLQRRQRALTMLLGGSLGFFLGVFVPIALQWGVGAVLLSAAGLTGLGMGLGAWLGSYLNRCFPPMLSFHAREHRRLREVVQQVRAYLRHMTGLPGSYPELEMAVQQDAVLRVHASELRLQLEAKARSALTWSDYLAAVRETLREGGWRELIALMIDALKSGTGSGDEHGGTSGSTQYAEWVWGAYRARLRREMSQIQRRQSRSESPGEQESLRLLYAQKERELSSFEASERAVRELEGASAAITACIENLYTEAVQLMAQPQAASARVDALLEPLRQQVAAYEQAIREVRAISDQAGG